MSRYRASRNYFPKEIKEELKEKEVEVVPEPEVVEEELVIEEPEVVPETLKKIKNKKVYEVE